MFIVSGFGKILVLFGVILIILGVVVTFVGKVPLIGKLPGDIYIRKENFTFYFPLASSILLSTLISLVLFLIGRRQ